MKIDYTKVIRNCVEPKLGYHGFKYNEEKSHPPTGLYEFTRTYWGKTQRVSISRVQYNLEEVSELIAEGDDIPTEVPPQGMLIQEPGYRLWLSNRYVTAVTSHEYGSIEITRTGLADYAIFKQLANMPPDKAELTLRKLRKENLWWEFRNVVELRRVLRDILEMVLTRGLDWFEQQVGEIRRHNEKLNRRSRVQQEKKERRTTEMPEDGSTEVE